MELAFDRQGAGEPLVLLHGLGSRRGVWDPVRPALAAHFDVIAPDLPGFGDSPLPPAQTPPGPVSLCELLLEWLSHECGVEPGGFHVAGNSLGGLLALMLARRGAARSACGLSPAGFATPLQQRMAGGLLRTIRATAQRLAPRADTVFLRPGARRLLLGAVFAHPERVPPAAAAADIRAMAAAPWFTATLPSIERWDDAAIAGSPRAGGSPVTVAWGERDRILPARQAQRARAELPGVEIVLLPGCGHVPMWDAPELVARVIGAATGRAAPASPSPPPSPRTI